MRAPDLRVVEKSKEVERHLQPIRRDVVGLFPLDMTARVEGDDPIALSQVAEDSSVEQSPTLPVFPCSGTTGSPEPSRRMGPDSFGVEEMAARVDPERCASAGQDGDQFDPPRVIGEGPLRLRCLPTTSGEGRSVLERDAIRSSARRGRSAARSTRPSGASSRGGGRGLAGSAPVRGTRRTGLPRRCP